MKIAILRLLILVVMAAMMAGCGKKYVFADGRSIPVYELKSAAEIDKKMAEDGVLSMHELAASNTAEAREKADLAGVGSAVRLTGEAAFFGMQFAPAIFGAVSAASNVIMSFWTIGDLMTAHRRYQERVSSVSARLKFNKPLEIHRVRDGDYEFFLDILGTEDERENHAKQMRQCGWLELIKPGEYKGNGAYYRAGADDASITVEELTIRLKYGSGTEKIPEENPCSLKGVETLLAQKVALITGNKIKE